MIDIHKSMKGEREVVKVSLKDMGHEIGKKHLMLWHKFLSNFLNAGRLDATMPDFIRSFDIVCPYCKKGILKLTHIEPVYSGGRQAVPRVKHHTSNNYNFDCECGAKFFGYIQWMWID